MCVFLGSRISLHPPPPLILSFHKPSDAELTYFLGAEIQKDERRFTSYFLFFFLAEILASLQPTPFSCLRYIHLFLYLYPSLSTAHSPRLSRLSFPPYFSLLTDIFILLPEVSFSFPLHFTSVRL